MMPAKLDYHWHLREVMADRGMFQTTDLIGPLEQRGITLSSSQVYRLVVERPERRSSRPRRGQPGERRPEPKPASGVCNRSGHAFAAPNCRDRNRSWSRGLRPCRVHDASGRCGRRSAHAAADPGGRVHDCRWLSEIATSGSLSRRPPDRAQRRAVSGAPGDR
jgi:hypothetical protein